MSSLLSACPKQMSSTGQQFPIQFTRANRSPLALMVRCEAQRSLEPRGRSPDAAATPPRLKPCPPSSFEAALRSAPQDEGS